MHGFQKRQLAVVLALGAALALGSPGIAQESPGIAEGPTILPSAPPAAEPEAPADAAARLDTLFTELAEPGRDDWERIEGEIVGIWSKSGSPSMDLLLRRGNEAIKAEDYDRALEHFSALTDHAPDFAEGWNARATAFYLMGEYSLAMADVERTLALNPRHFGAMSGLAFMFEAMGEDGMALEVLRAVQGINPNRPNINEAVTRLERMNGEADL